jgi:hypothetical protein
MLSDDVEAQAQVIDAAESLDDLVRWLLDANKAASALSILKRDVEQEIAAIMTDTLVELPGLPPFEKKLKAKTTKWDSDGVFDEICRLDDPLDGFRKAAPLTGSLGWRKAALRDLGIDPDDYCTRSWTDVWSIRFHGDAS